MACKTRGRDAVAGAAEASGCDAAFCIRHDTDMQSAVLLTSFFSFIASVNDCVLRQLCTAELVRLTAAGGGVSPLRKRVQRSRAALKTATRLILWHLVRRALA